MIWPQVYVECSYGLSMQSWAHHYRTDKSPERDGAASKRAASKSRSRSRRKSCSRRRSRSKRSKSRGKRPGSWKRWWRHGDTSLIKLSRLFCLPKLAWSPSSYRRSRSRRRRRSSSKSRDKKRSSRWGAGLALTWLWGFLILGGLESGGAKLQTSFHLRGMMQVRHKAARTEASGAWHRSVATSLTVGTGQNWYWATCFFFFSACIHYTQNASTQVKIVPITVSLGRCCVWSWRYWGCRRTNANRSEGLQMMKLCREYTWRLMLHVKSESWWCAVGTILPVREKVEEKEGKVATKGGTSRSPRPCVWSTNSIACWASPFCFGRPWLEFCGTPPKAWASKYVPMAFASCRTAGTARLRVGDSKDHVWSTVQQWYTLNLFPFHRHWDCENHMTAY